MKSLRGPLLVALLTLSTSDAAVFWRDPGPVESLDLANGPGGADKAPKAPFTFVEEDKGGTAPKVTVKDANGALWIVKFGEEVKAENFATRIAWAAGYFAAPTYYVPSGRIEGANNLGRANSSIKNGEFSQARFQLKDEAMFASKTRWKLGDSKLKDSRELAGYKTVMILLSNWDVKPENLSVLEVGGEQVYAITDLGATMGRPGELTGRSKWDCKRYSADSAHLLEGVDNGFVVFNYSGKQGSIVTRGIKVADVAWVMERLGKLSDAQIQAALQASGATPEETACFSQAFRTRLELLASVGSGKQGSEGTVTRTIRTETKTVQKEQ